MVQLPIISINYPFGWIPSRSPRTILRKKPLHSRAADHNKSNTSTFTSTCLRQTHSCRRLSSKHTMSMSCFLCILANCHTNSKTVPRWKTKLTWANWRTLCFTTKNWRKKWIDCCREGLREISTWGTTQGPYSIGMPTRCQSTRNFWISISVTLLQPLSTWKA